MIKGFTYEFKSPSRDEIDAIIEQANTARSEYLRQLAVKGARKLASLFRHRPAHKVATTGAAA